MENDIAGASDNQTVIIHRQSNSLSQCPACEFKAKRESSVLKHISLTHAADPIDLYVKHVLQLTARPLCACGCGVETNWISLRRGFSNCLQGHNAKRACVSAETAVKRKIALRDHYKTHSSWSKGLTKESDKRVAERSAATSAGQLKRFASGATAWSKGLTKHSDERIAAMAESSAAQFRNGERVPLMKGLSKETDEKIAAMAAKVSATHRDKALRSRLDSQKRRSAEEIRSLIETDSDLIITAGLDEYTNENKSELTVKCTAGHVSKEIAVRLYSGRCKICHPLGSKGQTDLFRFVKSVAQDAVNCDREQLRGKEIDIFISSKKFGLEYNGLYWHSSEQKSHSYHEDKRKLCESADIKLFQIFDDEWRDKRAIVESMIRHRLRAAKTRLFARDCEIVQISVSDRRSFFNSNHLDGDCSAIISFGLQHREMGVVAVMSLRRPFHARKAAESIEIARWSCALDTCVIGGLGKLLNAAKQIATALSARKLLTYCDLRHGDGRGYEAVGFKKVSVTRPRFWWTDGQKRYDRFRFRADKRRKMTEKEVAAEANVLKIYGCGNAVYEMTL